MTRLLVLALLFAGAIVAEESAGGLPWIGPAAPDLGLLLVMIYAMKGPGEGAEILCLLAGTLKAAVCGLPAGFFILAYLVLSWLVIQMRSRFVLEYGLAQAAVVFLAGCLLQAARTAAAAAGVIPGGAAGVLAAALLSSATAALLAAPAAGLYDRWRLLRILLRP